MRGRGSERERAGIGAGMSAKIDRRMTNTAWSITHWNRVIEPHATYISNCSVMLHVM